MLIVWGTYNTASGLCDERVRWLVCEIRNVLRSAVSRFTEREVPNHTLDEIFKFGGLFGGRILV